MSIVINKYPLDLTGRSPDNLIIGEPHTLVDNGRDGMRVFVPNYGAFYTNSLVVRDSSGVRLMPNTDFIATYLHEETTQRSGLEVCGVIVIINPNVTNEVSIEYQVVGGEYAFSTTSLEQVLQTLADDDRPVEWGSIIGKPSEYPAGGHLHALWELYGFEYLVVQLERIHSGILTGDQAMFDEVRRYAYELYEDGKDYTDQLGGRFEDHLADYTNPHQVTKTQVGLGNVENFPIATVVEAEEGTAMNRYMTPGLTDKHFSKRAQNLDASNLTKGRVPDARLYGTYTNLDRLESNEFHGRASDSRTNPSFSWQGDTNTGMFRDGTDGIGLSVDGTTVFTVSKDTIWSKGDVAGFSDRRLKRNFRQFDDALDRVRRLVGGVYERIDLDGRLQVGMIAQEVMEVIPEVVDQHSDGLYGISYANLVAVLVEAIKDMDQQHTQQIGLLRQELDALYAKLGFHSDN